MTDLLDDAPPALRCPQCDAEMGSPAGLASHMRSQHGDVVRLADEPASLADNDGIAEVKQEGKGWRRFFGTPKAKAERPGPVAKPPARRRHKRVSGATVLAIPFEQGANVIEQWKPCTARVLAWEAGWGGYVLDEALAGTLPDRLVVQPLARNWERFAAVEAVLGPVAIAFAIESHPDKVRLLMPEMRRAIRGAAPFMLKAMAKKKTEDAQIEAAFREAYPDAPGDASADEMIDALLADVFAPIMKGGPDEPAAA